MAEVFMPRHPHGSMDMMAGQDESTRSTSLAPHQSPGIAQSEPNPPYVFPGFQDPATMQNSYRMHAGNSETADTSRRPASRRKPKNLSINASPPFDFGAGSESSAGTRGPSPSPTRSPARRTPPPYHTSGHRRGASEFVGGDVTNPITAGVSPVKSEDALSLPQNSSGPPTARRGHAHRRSGAVSQHDLSMILKPPSDGRGGSAPTTPSDLSFEFRRPSHPETDRSMSQPASTTFTVGIALSQSKQENNQSRTRVTFNNDPEVIPRPLSTISSDTSSSMSTARASHSVTNSITSVVSGGASSPSSARIARFGSGSTDGESNRRRTKSSGSLSRSISQGEPSWVSMELAPQKRPSSAPPEETDDQELLGLQPIVLSPVSEDGPTIRCGKNDTSTLQIIDKSHSEHNFQPSVEARKRQFSTPSSPVIRPRTSPEPKFPHRQKKVKSWAGSILSRKVKPQLIDMEPIKRRTPTPTQPPSKLPTNSEFSLDDVTFDEDTTCIIETPRSYPAKPSPKSTNYPIWNQQDTDPPSEDENPMLDIDAALGSLDRPGQNSTIYDGGAGFGNTKRRMHSSGETGGFSGPGMHYHRRSESAPELDFFDHGRLGFVHRGSNPAMAEAIEEEEEEEEERKIELAEDGLHAKEQELGLGVNIVECGHSKHEPTSRRMRRLEDLRHEPVSPRSLDPEPQQAVGGVEIVGADEEPRFSVITKSSDGSTITPTLSPEPLAPNSAPLDITVPSHSFIQASETASAISSPDFTKTSFDNHDPPRVHTATSSITDRTTMSSSQTCEHGHSSVDDIPSLTSSASTMISGRPTRFSSSANTTASSAERSYSLSAAVPARTTVRPGSSKRSSLASLSRFVGTSHNKSKLNIAELAPPDSPEKKRGKRLSRLLFWKSKEKMSS